MQKLLRSACKSTFLFYSNFCRTQIQIKTMSTYQLPRLPESKGLPESKLRLEELLAVNHRKYDIVYMGYRANHIPHALCSLYALGAKPEQIQKFNDYFIKRLDPLSAKKYKIDESNWENYIGDRSAYHDYLDFFDDELKTKTISEVFQKYVPRLIPGLIASALHPLIHLGYAMEFQSKIILSEGIAFACIAFNGLGEMVDKLDKSQADANQTATQLLKSIDGLNPPNFEHENITFVTAVTKAAIQFGPQIQQLLNKWEFDPKDSKILVEKTLDLTLASVMAFCGSYRVVHPDFFYAHGLTGNHAIRALLPHLETKDQRRLLQVGFLSLVALYFTRGPVKFDEKFVYKPKENSLGSRIDLSKMDWDRLFKLTNNSSDDHLIKVVRALRDIQKTIVEQPDSKIPKHLMIEAARLVIGTIISEDDWFTN